MYDYKLIPSEMKKLSRWVLWRKKPDSKSRMTKIPINARTGNGAKSNDPSTWTTFDKALENVEQLACDGLGFMLGNGYFGVDIDHAIDEVDLINEFVSKLNSYTEVSQSGEGIHIICKGVLPVGARRRGNIEMYDSARFFALTGIDYNGLVCDKLADRTSEIKALWEKYLNDNKQNTSGEAYVFTREKPVLTDEEVLAKAQESSNGNLFTCLYYGQWEGIYPSQSEADMSFCSLLAFWCSKNVEQMDRIFRTSKLYREKWDRKRGYDTYGNITIHNAIKNCKDVYNAEYSQSQVYNPASGEISNKKKYDLSDTGNAQRFIDKYGETIRYNFDNKCWMVFDGKTWIRDVKQIVKKKADIMLEEMKVEAIRELDKDLQKELLKNVKHLSNNSGKEAMLKEAMHIGDTPSTNADYDKQDYLLNCANGIINLRSGELLSHDKKYMMSKNTNVVCDFNNEPKRWIQFLEEIFGSKELVDYIHKAVGYSLTGETKEQCIFQCFGNGANGKSVFFDVLYEMMGDYMINSRIESILASNSNGGSANSEIARMNGARCIRTNEPNEGSRFNEGLVKQLSSGDITTARYLYGQEFEFKPKGKIWIITNYKLEIRGTDYGIWRRMRLVPFERKFEGAKADKHLLEKLMTELPQILGWAVKGAYRYYKEGLDIPKEMEREMNIYKSEMDIIASYLKDNCILGSGRTKSSELFKDYADWCKVGHEYCMTQSKFGKEIGKRFDKKIVSGCVHYVGVKLKKHDESYVYEKE